MNSSDYTVGQHLFDRLHELGIRHLFAIPGAHSSHWLHNYVEASSTMQRFGTTTALNAGYAADGYARMNGIGAVCVPDSVGALSLLSAVAGAFAERVPVVVINGAPRASSNGRAARPGSGPRSGTGPSHFDDPRAHALYERVTCASERISDPEQAPQQIDRTLRACLRRSRPVYLEPREDVYDCSCPPLQSALSPNTGSASSPPPPDVTDSIRTQLRQADSALLWGGIELQRYGLEDEFDALVRGLDVPFVTSILSKGLLSEQHDHFAGILDRQAMAPAVRALIESVDYVLGLGVDPQSESIPHCLSETGSATLLHNEGTADSEAENVDRRTMDSVASLRALLSILSEAPVASFNGVEQAAQTRRAAPSPRSVALPDPDATMTFQGFFNVIADYIEDDTILMSGIGLDRFGSQTLPVHTASGFVCQAAYSDMGYVTPASIGVDLGSDAERVFVFVGDGGFQSAPQCVGTMAEKGIDPVIFVLNNGVYGGEQWRTDPAPFNQDDSFFPQTILQHWHYQKLPDALGGRGWRVETYGELHTAVDEAERYVGGPLVIDVRVKQKSLPDLLK